MRKDRGAGIRLHGWFAVMLAGYFALGCAATEVEQMRRGPRQPPDVLFVITVEMVCAVMVIATAINRMLVVDEDLREINARSVAPTDSKGSETCKDK